MTSPFASRRLRWAVPGGVAAAVAIASLTSSVTASASGQPDLAKRTAAQLLVALDQSTPPLFSGTLVETTHLGLPDLGSIAGASPSGGSADLSMENFLAGSHTLRIFYGGPDKQRVALLGSLSESDVVHDGTDLWTYSSTTRKVTHVTLKDPSDKPETAEPGSATSLTPTAAADRALAAIDPTTVVSVDRTARIAGRSAYQLLLTPRDTGSLIGSVRIALDAATSLPLRVQVFARGATSPALEIGFTDVTFAAPSAAIFHFVPPAGTKVTQQQLPFVSSDTGARAAAKPKSADDTGTKVIGKGWTAVVETTLPASKQSSSLGQLLDKASTPVAGGRLVTSALISVLFTPDGRVYAGPVSGAALQQIAAAP